MTAPSRRNVLKAEVSPETELWTRPNTSSGEFAALRASGVRITRQPWPALSVLYRLFDLWDRRRT